MTIVQYKTKTSAKAKKIIFTGQASAIFIQENIKFNTAVSASMNAGS
ncbi:hypothetical protein [Saccharobesus litoralis]|nr:hypothetical protein [Saccharobesus litoralis]